VVLAIQEEILQGKRGLGLGEIIRKRFEYGTNPKPVPEWEKPKKIKEMNERNQDFLEKIFPPDDGGKD